jgi:hypothetical protein
MESKILDEWKKPKKIQVLDEIMFKARPSGLINYQYIDNNGEPISAIFQATKITLKNWMQLGQIEFRLIK